MRKIRSRQGFQAHHCFLFVRAYTHKRRISRNATGTKTGTKDFMSNSKSKAKPGYVGVALVDESLKIKKELKDLSLPAAVVDELELIYQEFLTLDELHKSSSKPAETLETLRSLKEEVGTLSSL